MKLTVNRKALVSTLKALRNLSAKADREDLKDTVVLTAIPTGLMLSAGPGTAFVSTLLECEVEREGTCTISYKLYELLKVAKDETITLSSEKNLSIRGGSGFRATLNEQTKAVIPAARMKEVAEAGTKDEIELETEELINLAELSNVFAPVGPFRWVEIICDGMSSINGSVQGSETGTLENFPMGGYGSMSTYILPPDLVLSILPFCGSHVRLGTLNAAPGFVMLSDPENNTWWALMAQLDRSTVATQPSN